MFDLHLVETLMNLLPAAGPQLLAVAALLCALGVPLPMPMLVLAGGALVQSGGANPVLMIAACLGGSLLGGSVYYVAGRYAGAWIQRHAGRLAAGAWQSAQERFGVRSALTVYLTRFLFTPIGIPTSLLAGSRQYPYWRFALAALAGDLMWVAGYGAAGYLAGPYWQAAGSALADYLPIVAAVIGAGLALRYAWQKRGRCTQAARNQKGPDTTVDLPICPMGSGFESRGRDLEKTVWRVATLPAHPCCRGGPPISCGLPSSYGRSGPQSIRNTRNVAPPVALRRPATRMPDIASPSPRLKMRRSVTAGSS